MPVADLFPPGWTAERAHWIIGLVSDTHMPVRCNKLPNGLFHALEGVNLLLHAGDVGELWVLDQLAAIAPVIAVHGNDDTRDAQRELPYQQLVVAGTRILLWHSHYPDWTEELASRKDNDPRPKLDRCGDHALRAGASVCVFGHWHIPLTYTYKSVLVVNPGAIASGNEITRQLRQTAALLFVDDAGACAVSHVDLNDPDRRYVPHNAWEAGFQAILAQYSASIFAPEISEQAPYLRQHLSEEAFAQLRPILLRLARRVWSGELTSVGYTELSDALSGDRSVSDDVRRQLLDVMENRPAI